MSLDVGIIFHIPFTDHVVHSLGDTVGVVVQTEVAEKHGTRQDHSTGVSLVLALDVQTNMTASRLEDSDVASHVGARNQTRATDKGSADVGENATVEVRHDHDVELLRSRDSLHGSVVDDHVVDLQGRVVLRSLVEGAAEQTVGKLHDVSLVNASDLLPVVGKGKAKSELGDTLGLGAGDDLQRLNNTLDRLVLEAGVFTLGVLTDDAEIDILVASLVAGDVLDQDNRGIDIELLAQSDVERLVTRTLDGGEKDTLQTQLVAAKRCNGFLKQLLRVLVARVHTTDVDLFPLNGYIVGLEDSLYRFGDLGTNAVTLGYISKTGDRASMGIASGACRYRE